MNEEYQEQSSRVQYPRQDTEPVTDELLPNDYSKMARKLNQVPSKNQIIVVPPKAYYDDDFHPSSESQNSDKPATHAQKKKPTELTSLDSQCPPFTYEEAYQSQKSRTEKDFLQKEDQNNFVINLQDLLAYR